MITEVAVGIHQATFDGFTAYGIQANTCTVIVQSQDDIGPLTPQVEANGAGIRLAGCAAYLGLLDAMVDGVAQHVFQRRDDALEHGAVHFPFGVADDELDLLAQLAGDLTHDATQARHQTVERHHARTHQAFLQLGIDPRLLQQQGLGVTVLRRQGFLEVEQVGGGLEQRTGQLLQLRVAVHLQRIEVLVAGTLGLGLVAAENLRLGLGIEPAQLVAYAVDGRFHLAQGEADIAHLLLDTATENRGLTGQVDQTL